MSYNRKVALMTSIFVPEDDRMMFSGADRYFVALYKVLEELGYEPHIWQHGTRKLEYEGMQITGLPYQKTELGGMPDLNIHFFEESATYDQAIYFAPFLAFPRVKPRSVVISHGIAWDYPSHPWNPIAGPLHNEWLRRIQYGVTAPDLFVSVDTNSLNWIRATWPGYDSKQAYIPNFVDLELFFPRDNPGDKITVLCPRRVTWIRGTDDMKVVAERLTKRYDNVEFHIVGRGGDDDTELQMRLWADQHPGCRYYWVPMSDMPEVYRLADIILIPTRAAEGTSLSCLEAMASGKAIISSWVGGLPDLIIDQHNGMLVNVSPDEWEKAVEDLIQNPDKRRRLGQKARETAETFSLQAWKNRWANALQKVWGDHA